ncbi:NAD-dependent epimerase/dehydratase family protein [Haloarcula sp. S1CR25-12]|uniref:NAD-dependent epimerase/dehydratase family protein n=1 Tax=Haloarcula saliterrae TaxID=2950534 RepID=A0ABU2FDT3_9EURY|nr:NAD-dependent epimerase/dehydratase family protein [Haloarcula sp. S1CR25-12]MDS0260419.1 NAD-dependent epimerase/dehydratase family protein [Haloarcula sp. S1CR25-12]
MEYLVTGATGLVGSHVVHQLVDAGHDVVGVTRSASNASHLPSEVTVVEGDITDKESLREPMTGVDGVFHIAAWAYVGPGPENEATAQRVNVEGTRNVLELMDELAVPKGVYTSTAGFYDDTGDEPVDESDDPTKPSSPVYLRTKWEAHYEVARPMMDDGLPLVVVLPGNAFGRWDKPYGTNRGVLRDYLQEDLPMVPRDWAFPFEHAADTARSHVRAMERGEPGEEYIVAGETRTMADMFALAEDITGVPAPRTAPSSVFGLMAGAMGVVERVATPPEGLRAETLAFLSGKDVAVDNSKAKRELGIDHRPLEDGLREYFEWEREQLATEA